MNNCVYELENLARSYGGQMIVSVDHLEIKEGEVLAIVGPSGAGKSTLLRLLNLLEAPDRGSLKYRGVECAGNMVPLSMRRSITTVFQRPMLLSGSVGANVSKGLRLRGRRGESARVREALQRVGLSQMVHRPAHKLSGGEAQRVALARALVIDPQVLLLDEPTANLDPYNVGLIESIVTEVNRERGTTIVLVTHNVFQARRLAHRAALMLEGRLVEVSDTETFFETPIDPRTAAFVRGDMVY